MTRFPTELAELLTPRGLAVIEGRDPLCGALLRSKFATAGDLLDPKACAEIPALLHATFDHTLIEMSRVAPDPKASVASATESLWKTARMLSTPMSGEGFEEANRRGTEAGLTAMLGSKSFLKLVEALCGIPTQGPFSGQVLSYRPGDYAGPHTDAHPTEPLTRNGYTDVHLTFCTPGVDQQFLVYEKDRHLSEMASITGSGTVTAYRLPFWHYTTPMQGSPGARRWLILGSFSHPTLQ